MYVWWWPFIFVYFLIKIQRVEEVKWIRCGGHGRKMRWVWWVEEISPKCAENLAREITHDACLPIFHHGSYPSFLFANFSPFDDFFLCFKFFSFLLLFFEILICCTFYDVFCTFFRTRRVHWVAQTQKLLRWMILVGSLRRSPSRVDNQYAPEAKDVVTTYGPIHVGSDFPLFSLSD